ncbi:MAG: hypothetical protein CML38_10470, partial [Rhodobacteraceae bacterium]
MIFYFIKFDVLKNFGRIIYKAIKNRFVLKKFFALFIIATLFLITNISRISAGTYDAFYISGYDYFHSDIYTAIELEFHDVKFDSSSETHLVEFQIHSHTDYRAKIYLELNYDTFN